MNHSRKKQHLKSSRVKLIKIFLPKVGNYAKVKMIKNDPGMKFKMDSNKRNSKKQLLYNLNIG